MRRSKLIVPNHISILTVDDDPIITDTIQDYFRRSGYIVDAENNPRAAIERVRNGNYDILLLDFLMSPVCGDQVVAEIREFNRDLFIILLTGHKSMAPPIKTIRQLDIQGYYEKDDRFDQLELLVESCVKSIKQMRTLREYETDLSNMVENLHKIYHLQDCGRIPAEIMDALKAFIPYSAGFVFLDHPDGQQLSFFGTKTPADVCHSLIRNAQWDGKNIAFHENWCLLRLSDEAQQLTGTIGILPEKKPEGEKLHLLNILSQQASSAITNSYLHSKVNLQHAQLEEAYIQTIETLRYAVETRDKETQGHSERVSSLACAMAKTMNLPADQIEVIRTAGLFHDIGKIGIPDSILLKNGPLTPEEFNEIKSHPIMGEKMLTSYAPLKPALPMIRGHHERMDGKGYPDGLAGQSICLGARIIAVADSFDAMVSNRTYRKGLSLDIALQELSKGKASQFDPEIVDALFHLIQQMGAEAFREAYCSHSLTNR